MPDFEGVPVIEGVPLGVLETEDVGVCVSVPVIVMVLEVVTVIEGVGEADKVVVGVSV